MLPCRRKPTLNPQVRYRYHPPMTDVPGGSRRLHGVLLADMTGFSRLMGEDESRAVAALMRIRDVFAAVVPRHRGTLDVFVGDCFVALFDSAVDAVQAALQIQGELAADGHAGDPVRIRIGIHLGDVVRSGTEILGDSINVAARIQAIAPPGGITVSEDVYRAVRNRVNVPVRDLGARSLKNIRDKMRVYVLDAAGAAPSRPAATETRPRRRLRPALTAVALLLVTAAAVSGYRAGWWKAPAGSATVRSPAPARAAGEVVTVGVTGVNASGDVPPWMQDTTRDGLNTLLSKVGTLRVFSREKIDFLRQRRGLTEIEVAETLGIEKMISGSLALQNGEVLLDVRVVDISTGILDASESLRGAPEELIELQNQLAAAVIAALGVHLSAEQETALFAQRTRETLAAYRRMADTFGEAPESRAPVRRERTSWLRWIGGGVAWADEVDPDVAALLEAYRAALESENVEAVAAVHVSLNEEQRAGFARYFESADGLKVSVGDLDVLLDGDEGVVTFTRRDVFRDRNSDKEVELEVRLSTLVVRKDGKWLMRGVRRS
jgi:class 3 adenylate cyclase/TolB-like protein